MSARRRKKVPPTFRDRLDRLAAVASEHSEPGGIYTLAIAHDEWCLAVRTQSLADCRCEPEFHQPRRVA